MKKYLYNSRNITNKNPFGAVEVNREIQFTFMAKDGVFINEIYLVLTKDGRDHVHYLMEYDSKDGNYSIFKLNLKITTKGLYWYHFQLNTENGEIKLFRDSDGNVTEKGVREYQITVFDKSYKTPDFIKGGLIYHIFVDRFNKGKEIPFLKKGHLKNWNDQITVFDPDGLRRANDFYGGNFQGIIDKIDYLKGLGVNALYLSPIFQSPSNHRYDTSDYMKIDDLLGTDEDFKKLVKECKKNGIKIILDGVFNHTGADSIYFNKFGTYDSLGAYQSKDSKYYDWFEFINFPNEYRCWWGVTICPSVNQNNMEYRQFITGDKGVISNWNKYGIGGWRLDVVDELIPEFVKEIRKQVKSKSKDNILIGEVWEDASNKISYDRRREYFLGDELDGVMNYVFKDAIIAYIKGGSLHAFKNKIMDIVENYPKQSLDVSFTLLGTHDTVRILTALADEPELAHKSLEEKKDHVMGLIPYLKAKKKLKLASFLQYTLPGVPSLYYADEIGMEGAEDPVNRRTLKWEYIETDINDYYKALGKLRKDNKDIFKGDIKFIDNPNGLLIFERSSKDRSFIFVLNNCLEDKFIDQENYKPIFNELILRESRVLIKANNAYVFSK